MAEITLTGRGDILLLYTDGLYDGSDEPEKKQIEAIIGEHQHQEARDICNAIMDYAVNRDERLRRMGQSDEVDDKTAFIIKRT
jgi:serine phosphatase RsbU (regulator of sigma subunit)